MPSGRRPPLRALPIEGRLAEYLKTFKAWGGVVEHVPLDTKEAPADPTARHHLAAVLTLEAIAQREATRIAEVAAKGHDVSRWRPIQTNPDKASGHPIEVAAMLGPFWDSKTGRLLIRGPHNPNVLVRLEAPGTPVVDLMTFGGPWGAYPGAFFEPPYDLHFPDQQSLQTVFNGIHDELFGGFGELLSIYEWSTDWSTYFDAGNDWWGSYLWTIENLRTGQMAGIGASSTD
jgi:hypothetical protein